MQYNHEFIHNLTLLSILNVITGTTDRHSPAVDSTSGLEVLAADTRHREPEAQGNSFGPPAVDLEAAVEDMPMVDREAVEGMGTSACCTIGKKAALAEQACSGTDFLKSIHCR